MALKETSVGAIWYRVMYSYVQDDTPRSGSFVFLADSPEGAKAKALEKFASKKWQLPKVTAVAQFAT